MSARLPSRTALCILAAAVTDALNNEDIMDRASMTRYGFKAGEKAAAVLCARGFGEVVADRYDVRRFIVNAAGIAWAAEPQNAAAIEATDPLNHKGATAHY